MRTGRPRRIRVFCLNALSKYLVERSDGTDISAIFDRCFSLSAEILRGELNRRHRGRHTAARARIPEQRKNYQSPHLHLHAIKSGSNLIARIRICLAAGWPCQPSIFRAGVIDSGSARV
jgi:hypothetical protein